MALSAVGCHYVRQAESQPIYLSLDPRDPPGTLSPYPQRVVVSPY
jgi:hypothetical protein